MERLRENAPVLITVLLGLLLVAYVFAGGSSRKPTGRLAPCSSAEAHELIKADLFRQAAALRGSNDPAFAALGRYSIVRMGSQVVRKTDAKAGTVACGGTIVLDLPPGVEVIGGRRSLEGKLTYLLAGREGSRPELRSLGNADAIVVPLASVASSGSATAQALPPPIPPEQDMNQGGVEPLPEAEQRPAPPPLTRPAPASPERRPVQAAPKPKRQAEARPAPQKPRPAPKVVAALPPKPAPAARPVPPPTASARPSFNCRYARRYGEVAACRDSALASLDRQMAGQFNQAMASASPGARTMLQRSRNRFLRARDACRSHSCVAAAYRQRMNEISGIMSGGF